MKIIDSKSLLTSAQLYHVQSCAAKPFQLGGYSSLENILSTLDVDVIIEPGILKRTIPSFFNDALKYWEEVATRIQKEIEKNKLNEELKRVFEILQPNPNFPQGMFYWTKMPLRGLYDPVENVIKLYPDEMKEEYDGMRMDELLVSTLAHETMHAYFNSPRHKFAYIPTVEEPLAEFGMLLYLKDTGSSYYNWAYDDVSRKRTCYKYGANLMDQYLKECMPYPTRQFLEAYKIPLPDYTVMSKSWMSGEIVLLSAKKSELGVDETPISEVGESKKAPFPIAPPPFPSHSPMDKGKLDRKTSSKTPSSVLKEPSYTDVVEDTVLCQFIKKVFIYLYKNKMIDLLANYINFETAEGPKITLSCNSEGKKFNLPGILYLVDCKETDHRFDSKRWFTDSFIIREKEYYLSSEWNGPEIGSLRFSQFVNMMKSVYPGSFEISFVMKKL